MVGEGGTTVCEVLGGTFKTSDDVQANADFIVAAVNAHASLTAERDQLRAALVKTKTFWHSDDPAGMSHAQFRVAAHEVLIEINAALAQSATEGGK